MKHIKRKQISNLDNIKIKEYKIITMSFKYCKHILQQFGRFFRYLQWLSGTLWVAVGQKNNCILKIIFVEYAINSTESRHNGGQNDSRANAHASSKTGYDSKC